MGLMLCSSKFQTLFGSAASNRNSSENDSADRDEQGVCENGSCSGGAHSLSEEEIRESSSPPSPPTSEYSQGLRPRSTKQSTANPQIDVELALDCF